MYTMVIGAALAVIFIGLPTAIIGLFHYEHRRPHAQQSGTSFRTRPLRTGRRSIASADQLGP